MPDAGAPPEVKDLETVTVDPQALVTVPVKVTVPLPVLVTVTLVVPGVPKETKPEGVAFQLTVLPVGNPVTATVDVVQMVVPLVLDICSKGDKAALNAAQALIRP
jgi:hypothetical protein